MKRIRPAVCKHIQDKWLNVSSRASSFWNVIPKTDMAALVATLKHYIHAAERAVERPSAQALASILFWDLCSPFLWKMGVLSRNVTFQSMLSLPEVIFFYCLNILAHTAVFLSIGWAFSDHIYWSVFGSLRLWASILIRSAKPIFEIHLWTFR